MDRRLKFFPAEGRVTQPLRRWHRRFYLKKLPECLPPCSLKWFQGGDCGKAVCSKHIHKQEHAIFCAECYAKQIHTLKSKEAAQLKREELQIGSKKKYSEWFFRQREILFYELNIEPFDETDFAAFNVEAADDYFDETDAGGLFDS